jgi:hypothetical protein
MLQELLKKDESYRLDLVMLENHKLQFELDNIDFSSKESMTKLIAQLTQNNAHYKTTCESIEQLKVEIEINHRQLSVVRELMNNKLLTSFEQVDRFLNQLKGQ